jgi:hypothetical protein
LNDEVVSIKYRIASYFYIKVSVLNLKHSSFALFVLDFIVEVVKLNREVSELSIEAQSVTIDVVSLKTPVEIFKHDNFIFEAEG